jgi:hypothetical protein
VSAGASGAIFGLLGAAVAELALHRKRYRAEWRRSLLGALVVVTIAQLGIGMGWSMIDQWAHVGGLVGGLAFGALLSPGWRSAERLAWPARVAAGALLALYAVAAVLAATTTYDDRLDGAPRVTRESGGLAVDVPADWEVAGDELRDPDLSVVLALDSISPGAENTDRAARLDAFVEAEQTRARDARFSLETRTPDPRIPLPDGFEGRERILVRKDDLGTVQRYRVILFAGEPGGKPMVGVLYVPDLLAVDAAAELGEILATIRRAP